MTGVFVCELVYTLRISTAKWRAVRLHFALYGAVLLVAVVLVSNASLFQGLCVLANSCVTQRYIASLSAAYRRPDGCPTDEILPVVLYVLEASSMLGMLVSGATGRHIPRGAEG